MPEEGNGRRERGREKKGRAKNGVANGRILKSADTKADQASSKSDDRCGDLIQRRDMT